MGVGKYQRVVTRNRFNALDQVDAAVTTSVNLSSSRGTMLLSSESSCIKQIGLSYVRPESLRQVRVPTGVEASNSRLLVNAINMHTSLTIMHNADSQ